MLPWAELARGPVTAEKSLLLDYISPSLLVSIWKAIKQRHWLILATVSGFVLIKAMTVISTGLLVLENVLVADRAGHFQLDNAFDASTFAHGQGADSESADIVYGVFSHRLIYPPGTTATQAFQTFQAMPNSTVSPSALLEATVDYFAADLDCEVGSIVYSNSTDESPTSPHWETTPLSQFYETNISTPSCQVVNADMDAPDNTGSGFWGTSGTLTGYKALLQTVNCTNLPLNSEESSRLFISVGYSKRANYSNRLVQATGLLCKPTYQIGRARVLANNSLSTQDRLRITPLDNEPSRSLGDLSPWDVVNGVLNGLTFSLQQGNEIFNSALSFPVTPSYDDAEFDAFFDLIAALRPGMPTSDLMDPSILIESSRKVFQMLAAQMARQLLLSTTTDTVNGTFSDYDNRIVVRVVPARLMEAISALLLCLSAGLLFLVPRHVTSRPISTIGGVATILARSTTALKHLEGTGASDLEGLTLKALQYRYRTSISNVRSCFGIERWDAGHDGDGDLLTPISRSRKQSQQYWRPMSFSLPLVFLTLAAPVLVGVALELVYRRSLAHQGLADEDVQSPYHYAWIYIPALTLFTVATLLNKLDFEVESIQPYLRLSRGNAPARESIMSQPLAGPTLQALWLACRDKQLTVIATALSVLLAPLLTVVVSGLFTIEQVPYIAETQLTEAGWFKDYMTTTTVSNGSFGILPGLIVERNLAYPQWTYEDYALPPLELQTGNGSTGATAQFLSQATSLNTKSRALRPVMNCSIYPPELSHDGATSGFVVGEMAINITVPDHCGNIGSNGTMSNVYIDSFITPPVDGTGYFGTVVPLEPPCDRLLYLVTGHITKNVTDDLIVYACLPYIESLVINTTFKMPGFMVSSDHPPIPDESSVEIFSRNYFIPDDLPYLHSSTDVLSPFFTALVFGNGTSGIPAATLFNNATLVLSTANRLYGIYVAQALGANFRYPLETSSPNASTLNATYTYLYRSRLIQNGLSTRILQGLLAAIFICALIAYSSLWVLTRGTRRVLPKNPRSVASVASLLIGSAMLNGGMIPEGAEWLNDRQLAECGVFDGYVFGLGWWDTGHGGKRFGIEARRAT